MRVNPRMRLQHSVFRIYVNMLHVIKDERDKASRSSAAAAAAAAQQQQQQQQQGDEETVNFSPDLERQILALSQDPVSHRSSSSSSKEQQQVLPPGLCLFSLRPSVAVISCWLCCWF